MEFQEEYLKYQQMKADVKVLEQKLENRKQELYQQQEEFERLCKSMEKEKADFDKLQKTSLAQLLAKIAGNYDEKCEKEYREYIAAKRSYDDAQFQLNDTKLQVSRMEAELESLRVKIPEKIKQLRENFKEGKELGEKLDAEKEALLCQKKELSEAIQAVEHTRHLAEEALASFSKASSAATFDTFLNGGFFTDMVKYSAMEEAQNLVYGMKTVAASMKKELSDVDITFQDNLNVIDGGTKTFDIFFDNIFTDWNVREQISANVANMQDYVDKLERVETLLWTRIQKIDEELENYVF